MLIKHTNRRPHRSVGERASHQRGVTLIVAMIVLVAMMLGGIALTRSVFTTNLIAGNLAFQKSATNSSDVGVESAIAWLEAQSVLTSASSCVSGSPSLPALACDQTSSGYVASQQNPSAGQSWSDFWDSTLKPNNMVKTLSRDGAGNTSAYVIQRMCSSQGDAASTGISCSTSPTTSSSTCAGGSTCDTQGIGLNAVSQVYYRITVRVQGPNNTVSLVQAMVAI